MLGVIILWRKKIKRKNGDLAYALHVLASAKKYGHHFSSEARSAIAK
jgi:hypothetical protein